MLIALRCIYAPRCLCLVLLSDFIRLDSQLWSFLQQCHGIDPAMYHPAYCLPGFWPDLTSWQQIITPAFLRCEIYILQITAYSFGKHLFPKRKSLYLLAGHYWRREGIARKQWKNVHTLGWCKGQKNYSASWTFNSVPRWWTRKASQFQFWWTKQRTDLPTRRVLV